MANLYNNSTSKRVYMVLQDKSQGYVRSSSIVSDELIMLDATTEVSVNYSSDVTSYFVNAGTDSADHIKNNPRVINFSGVISNDTGVVDFVRDLVKGQDSAPAILYHTKLKEAMENKALFRVSVPNVGVINNCVLTQCSFRTNARHYNAFEVTIELKEIRLPQAATAKPTSNVVEVVPEEKDLTAEPTVKKSVPAVVKKGALDNPQTVASQSANSSSTLSGITRFNSSMTRAETMAINHAATFDLRYVKGGYNV